MGWQAAASLNVLIALCYVLISGLILQGLLRTRQLTSNPLAVATAAIFTTCALHHGHHAAHLMIAFGGGAHDLSGIREVFGEWHTVLIDAVGAAVAVTYLGLRRNYKTLLNTPAMFDDAVRVAAEERLRELAFTDQLTGIPNRASYQQHADALVGDLRPVAVLFVDLDGFKAINDRHGHDTGDRLLHDVAQHLAAGLGDGESVFRLGGDEFVVVGVGHGPAEAAELVERVRSTIAAPIQVRDGAVVVSASIGLATGVARTGIDQLLRHADAAMYARKGLNRQLLVPPSRSGTSTVEVSARA